MAEAAPMKAMSYLCLMLSQHATIMTEMMMNLSLEYSGQFASLNN